MYQYNATVVRWVDGDTVILDVDMGFYLWQKNLHFRLNRVNTPERGQPRFDEAVKIVNELAPVGSRVVINTYKEDKYGRWLCDIMDAKGQVQINQILLEYGWVYNG